MRKTKKLLSVLLSLCMTLGLVATGFVVNTVPAAALYNSSGDQWIYPVWVTASSITAAENLASGTSGTYYYDPSTGDYGIGSSYPLSWSAVATEANNNDIDAFYKAYVVINGSYYSMTGTFIVGSASAVQTLDQNSQLYCPKACSGTVENSGTYYTTVPSQGNTETVTFACYTRMWHANGANLESSTSVTLNFTTNCSHSRGYNTTVTPATCTSGGYTTYVCKTCGYTFTGDSTSALGHNYNGAYHNVSNGQHNQACERFAACGTYGVGSTQNATVGCSGGAATCTAQPVCAYCHTAYGSNLGHDWDYANASFNWNGYSCPNATVACSRGDSSTTVDTTVTNTITTQPTCEGEGVRTYTASFTAGGHTYTSQKMEAIQPLGHHYNGIYHNVSAGTHNQACERFDACGTYGVGTTKNATTPCSGGEATCTSGPICGACRTVYGNSLGHDWDYANAVFHWNGYACPNATIPCGRCDSGSLVLNTSVSSEDTTPATCAAQGERTYTASFTAGGVAYTSQKTEPISATGVHTWGWITDTEPTCGAAGVKHEECSVCHAKRNEGTAVDPTGAHSYTAATVKTEALKTPADCVDAAAYYYSCAVCGAVEFNNAHTFTDGEPLGHQWKWVTDTEPTCGEPGVKHEACTVCGVTRNDGTVIDPTGEHEFEWVTDTEPTCGEPGVKHEACTVCGVTQNDGTVIDSTGEHEFEWVTDTEPTCGEPGVKHEACTVCGVTQNDGTVIDPTGEHEFEWVVDTEPTCGTAGTKHEKCKNCDAVQSENTAIPATGEHEYEWVVDTEATCGTAGVKHEKCKNCEAVQSENTAIPATGEHEYEWVVDTEATCGTAGAKHEKCKNCDAVQSENTVIPATGEHEFEWVVDTEATCGAAGAKHEKCKNCDAVQNENTVISATGEHEFEWVIDTEATCGTAGVKHEKCKNCDAVQSENTVIPATGEHEFEWVVDTEPTCGAAGAKHEKCKNCDAVQSENTAIPATGEHEYEWVVDTEPTCGTAGVKHEKCKNCDAVQSENTVIPATGEHEYEWVVDTEPTCGTAGAKHEKCKNCDAVQSENTVIPATGEHEFEWIVDTEPTCGTAGEKHEKCKNCDAVQSENTVIPATGEHEFEWVVDTEATCGTAGAMHEKCKNCDAVQNENTAIPATGEHEFEWVVDTEATCGTAGVKHEKCKNCDAVQSENTAIPATGEHEFEWVVDTEATCGAAGAKHEKCKNCDAVQNENTVIPATGVHTDGDPVIENEAPATCDADGSYETVVYCAVCGAELSREPHSVPAGHKPGESVKENETAATCTADGSYEIVVYCADCGAELSRESKTVTAPGHQWDGGVTTPATCVAAGKTVLTCTVCGETMEIPLPVNPDNHTGGTEVRGRVAATKEQNGYTGDTYCKGCGELLETGRTVKYQSSHCPYCGGEHTGVLGAIITAVHGILWLFRNMFRIG